MEFFHRNIHGNIECHKNRVKHVVNGFPVHNTDIGIQIHDLIQAEFKHLVPRPFVYERVEFVPSNAMNEGKKRGENTTRGSGMNGNNVFDVPKSAEIAFS
jgi:hypothetical protein